VRVTLTQNPKPWDGDRPWEATAETSNTTISTVGPDPLTTIWLLAEALARGLEETVRQNAQLRHAVADELSSQTQEMGMT
jgi:hypothetical protein